MTNSYKAIRFCPLCGRKPLSNLKEIATYFYCGSCELGWKKKFPKINYQKDYYQGRSGLASRLFQPMAEFFYFLRRRTIKKAGVNLWIDVGAGEGEFLKAVMAKRKIGVEISSSGRAMMEKRGLEAITDKNFLKERDLKADVISFWHVLEHVENPWDYLLAARKNLSQKGKVVIGVPNIDSLEFRFFGRDWFHLQPQFHFWHFSTKSMIKMLEKAGFKIKKIDYWSLEHHLTGVLQSFINRTSGPGNVLHKLIKREAGFSSLGLKDLFWSLFWLTLGLPVVFLFWIVSAIFHKSGTIVIIASVVK